MRKFPEGSITFITLLSTAIICLTVGYASPPEDNSDAYWNRRWEFYKNAERDYNRSRHEFLDKWRKMTLKEIKEMKTRDKDAAIDDFILKANWKRENFNW